MSAAGSPFLRKTLRDSGGPTAEPICVLSGGEPVVLLAATDQPRQGGRNQELVLAAIDALWDDGMRQLAILSGGTDGEDGPTNAAGAVIDANVLGRARNWASHRVHSSQSTTLTRSSNRPAACW